MGIYYTRKSKAYIKIDGKFVPFGDVLLKMDELSMSLKGSGEAIIEFSEKSPIKDNQWFRKFDKRSKK